VLSANC